MLREKILLMRIKEHIMKSKNIEQVNHALVVLRHFIDLSSKLLPFLDEINNKHNPSEIDLKDREKIIEVYNSYEFDDVTSKMLMDSNILALIKSSYERLMRNQPASQLLQAFDVEFSRLRKNWVRIDSN
jgi:hypothetical protein|tara:strand:+ start:55707 stop:56093 length:387 start_codon:yes stop_codon:yes gene_type:complete